MGMRYVSLGRTEDGLDHADLHSCCIKTSERAPVIDDKTSPYHVGTTIDCASLKDVPGQTTIRIVSLLGSVPLKVSAANCSTRLDPVHLSLGALALLGSKWRNNSPRGHYLRSSVGIPPPSTRRQ